MQVEITTRAVALADYDALVELWRTADGVEIAEGDDRDSFAFYLERNPGLSRLAEHGGQLAGAVLCGHDGRRGVLYHLAVARPLRGKGIGRRLVREALRGLADAGIQRALILVAPDNAAGNRFWTAAGFESVDADVLGVNLG